MSIQSFTSSSDARCFPGRGSPLARAGELGAVGAYTSGCFAGRPWMLIETADEILGFHNVCRHKGHEVVRGSGVAGETLTCGYHGWQYTLAGTLASAPRMAGVRDFKRWEMSLPPMGVTRWGRWILASGDPRAPAIDLSELEHLLAATGWDRLRHARRQSWVIECNWKVFADNYLDGGYHIANAHPGLADQLDLDRYRTELFDTYSIQSAPPDTGGVERIGGGAIYAFIFPNFMINRYGPCMDTNWVVPLGPERCEVIFDYYFEEPDSDFASESIEASEQVQREDIALCESVQRGLRSLSYDRGRYAPRLEIAEHHFHSLVARALRST